MKMELNDEHLIELAAPADKRLDQAIPGAKWSPGKGVWMLPLSWAACTVAREVLGEALDVGPELAAWANEEYERRVLPASVARESTDGPDWSPAQPGDPRDTLETEVDHSEFEEGGDAADPTKAWWWDIWRGMPEYLHRDLAPWKQLIVSFRSPEDFEAFARAVNQRIGVRTRSIWFPEAEILHEIDWRYADEEDPPTDAPTRKGHVQRIKRAREANPIDKVLEQLA